MDAYEKRFIELLTYADYRKDDKVNIQIFLSGSPTLYRDEIQYDMPKTLKEVIGKEQHSYKLDRNKEHKNLKEEECYMRPNKEGRQAFYQHKW